ncbi:lipoprotein lipase-like [Leguminivora glycinivorella]|uniref:lipoprotein lipase-like n=1 Tax=Leguminivora glycinivorella TaxID=1035111 RepID=UPI00200EFA13|nr:lipoprotein lipase-like [Leguminivora glycinivorella]
MWRINLVFLAATCIFSACECASVVETAAGSRTARLTNIRYFQSSWAHMVDGSDLEEVEKSDTGAAGLGLTADTVVAVVVHGRESSVYSDFGNTLRFSLAQADPDLVIIMVDWSYLSYSSYQQAVATVPFIATDLREFIALLVSDGNLALSNLHLIGFDLGAHIVGIASRNAATRAIKITALDPAGAL